MLTARAQGRAARPIAAFASILGLLLAAGAAAQDRPAPATARAPVGASVQAAQLTPGDQNALQRVEDYLNSITTLSARFQQADSAGKRASGHLYIQRPGKLRFEYDPPTPVLIVANGRFLIHYDRSLKTASYIDQKATPAWFLLAPRVELGGDVTVTDVTRRDGRLLVTLVKTRDPGQGKVTLIFDESPMRLEQWAVTDAQGVVTHVMLDEVEVGGRIDPKLFEFNEPTWDGRNR